MLIFLLILMVICLVGLWKSRNDPTEGWFDPDELFKDMEN